MTDDEIDQYLNTIESIFTVQRKEIIDAISRRKIEINAECQKLNLLLHSPPPVGIVDQDKNKKDEESKSSIRKQLQAYHDEIKNLRIKSLQNSFLAERDGFREEIKNIRQMPRTELSDIQKQAELLNILSNKCLQLEAAVELIKRSYSHNECRISFGPISLLRGNWEDAIKAVSLTNTENGKIYYQNGRAKDDVAAELAEHPKNSEECELSVFKSMERLLFKEITICIDPDKYVLRVSARDKKATISFRILGLTNKNEITLNRQGEIFIDMANGNYSPDESGKVRAISRLSNSLRKAFGTKDSPFLKGKPQFKLNIPKYTEAKRRAAYRTITYDDEIAVKKYDNANDFFRNHDPSFDPHSPLYSPDEDL